MVGYSSAELIGRTWMEITELSDVGGDMAAVESVIDGSRNSYTTAKKYKHKNGDEIPVVLTVWRFPPGSGEMVGFSVEAVPSGQDWKIEFAKLKKTQEEEAERIIKRIESLEHRRRVMGEVATNLMWWLPLITALGAAFAWVVSHFGK